MVSYEMMRPVDRQVWSFYESNLHHFHLKNYRLTQRQRANQVEITLFMGIFFLYSHFHETKKREKKVKWGWGGRPKNMIFFFMHNCPTDSPYLI